MLWPINAPPRVGIPPLDRATQSHHPLAGDERPEHSPPRWKLLQISSLIPILLPSQCGTCAVGTSFDLSLHPLLGWGYMGGEG